MAGEERLGALAHGTAGKERVLKTLRELLETDDPNGWQVDKYGLFMRFDCWELRIEPMLYGGFYLAVYDRTHETPELIGEKLPVPPDFEPVVRWEPDA